MDDQRVDESPAKAPIVILADRLADASSEEEEVRILVESGAVIDELHALRIVRGNSEDAKIVGEGA